MIGEKMSDKEKEIYNALKTVIDPELTVNFLTYEATSFNTSNASVGSPNPQNTSSFMIFRLKIGLQ